MRLGPDSLDQLLPNLWGDRSWARALPAELVTGTASELNDLLAAGELDVSVVSAVEYARNASLITCFPTSPLPATARCTASRSFPNDPSSSSTARPCSNRVLPDVGPLAGTALPPSMGHRPAVCHREGRGQRPRVALPDCLMRRCSSSAMRLSCWRRGIGTQFRSTWAPAGRLDRPAVCVRGMGGATNHRPDRGSSDTSTADGIACLGT